MALWFSTATSLEVERLEGAWPDAPVENEEICSMLLDIAKEQVIAYAPEPEAPFPEDGVPARLVYAQLQQSINLWNAGSASPTGDAGAEGFSFTPRPLDKTIRSIIRPTTGTADVF